MNEKRQPIHPTEAQEQEKNPSAYSALEKKVKSGDLELFFIVSPPRSSSTALERALSNSDDITMQINDPWALFDDEDRENKTYEYILQKVESLPPDKRKAKVLIKNVADYIPPGKGWERQQALSKHTIFLVRNPVLSLESLVQVMAKEIDPQDVLVDSLTMDAFARNKGYKDWKDMQGETTRKRDYRDYEDVYKNYFPAEQNMNASPIMRLPLLGTTKDTHVQPLGFTNRDEYAQANGYRSWEVLQEGVKEGSVSLEEFQDLFNQLFLYRITGWDALGDHMAVTQSTGATYSVVDSTMYRAQPDSILGSLGLRIGISIGEQVHNWEGGNKIFSTDYDGEVPYYDKVVSSKGITFPTEEPIDIDRFPPFLQTHLLGSGGAISTYLDFLTILVNQGTDAELHTVLNSNHEGKSILEIDPLFGYMLVDRVQRSDASVDDDQLKNKIRNKYPNFLDIFNKIDAFVRE